MSASRSRPKNESLRPMTRREFLSATLATIGAGAGGLGQAATSEPRPLLPTVRWGAHDITRLLVGHNPIKGISHVSSQLDQEMRQWFVQDRRHGLDLLQRCQEMGINTCQMGFRPSEREAVQALLRAHDQEGGTLQWIATFYSLPNDQAAAKAELAHLLQMRPRPIGIQQVGNTTDLLMQEGKIDLALENLKRFRDTGLLVGLCSHHHEVIDYAQSKNWDLDFYQCCFYRSVFRLKGGFGEERFDEADRRAMVRMIRQVPKPCLAFKVLAASRHCGSPETLEQALRFAFENIKPTDVVLLGMWQKHKDQVAENTALARKILTPETP